jgi:hypothetical protein
MDAYCLEVRKLENKFYGLEFHHIVRDNNVAADVLSKLGSTHAQVPAGVFVHELHAPSIPEQAPPTTAPAHTPAGQEVMMIDVREVERISQSNQKPTTKILSLLNRTILGTDYIQPQLHPCFLHKQMIFKSLSSS